MQETITVALSEEVLGLVKAGIYNLESGGARDPKTGRLIELYKVVDQSTKVPQLVPGSQAVFGVINTAQMCYMQKGINEISKKSDMILKATRLVTKISILNTFISVVNTGVSIVGFSSMNEKLSKIVDESIKQNELLQKVINDDKKEKRNNLISRYNICSQMIKYFLDCLINKSKKPNDDNITEKLAESAEFLKNLEEMDYQEYLTGFEWCSMVIQLSAAYAQLIGIYSAEFENENDREHSCLQEWLKPINNLKSETLKNRLLNEFKKYIFVEYPEASPEELRSALDEFVNIPCYIESKIDLNKSIGSFVKSNEREKFLTSLNECIMKKINNPLAECKFEFNNRLVLLEVI